MAVHTERLVLEAETNTKKASAELTAFEAQVDGVVARIGAKSAEIKVNVNPDMASAEAKVVAGVKAIQASAPSIEIETDIDTDFLQRKLGSALAGLGRFSGRLNIGNIFQEFTQGAQQAQRALVGMGSAIPPLISGGAGMASSFGNASSSIGRTGYAVALLIPLIGVAIGVVGALTGAIGALAGTLAAIPGIIAGVVGALGVLFIALQPVFAAFSAFRADKKKISAGGGGGGGGRQLQNAARQQEQAARRVRNAQEAVAEAYRQAALGAEDAAERVSDAQKNLADAQKEAAKNQERLNEAREEARERVDDLRRSLRRLIVDEERATDNIESARQAYERTLVNPFADAEAQSDALLEVREAEADLAEIQDDRQDVAKELAKVDKKGIDSTEAVTDALEQNRRANEALTDAQEDLSDAREDSARQQVDAMRAIRDAQENLQDALVDSQHAADNFNSAMGGAGGGVSDFGAAMAKLSPAAKKFTNFLIGIWEAFENIQMIVQERFFDGLTEALMPVALVYLPIISEFLFKTADVLNQWVKDFAKLAVDPRFVKDIKRIFDSSVTIADELGQAFMNLTEFFVSFMATAAPFTEWLTGRFTDFTKKLSEGVKSVKGQEKITRFLDSIKPTLDALGSFSWEFLGELFDLFRELQPSATKFFDSFNENLPMMFESMKILLPLFTELAILVLPLLNKLFYGLSLILGPVILGLRSMFENGAFLVGLLGSLIGILVRLGQTIAVWFIEKFMQAIRAVSSFRDGVSRAIGTVGQILVGAWNYIYSRFIAPFIRGFQVATNPVSILGRAIFNLRKIVFDVVGSMASWLANNIRRITSPLGIVIALLDRARGLFSGLSSGLSFGIKGLFGGLLGNATGGEMTRSGLTYINEKGPEIVWLPKGAQIFNNDMFRSLAGNSRQFTKSDNEEILGGLRMSEEGPVIGTLVLQGSSATPAEAMRQAAHYRRAKMGIRR